MAIKNGLCSMAVSSVSLSTVPVSSFWLARVTTRRTSSRSTGLRLEAFLQRSWILGTPINVQRREIVSLITGCSSGIAACLGSSIQRNMAAAASPESFVNLMDFARKDNRRLLHVVYRVGNMEKTVKFYTEIFGLKLLRWRDLPEYKFTHASLAYGPLETNFAVELYYQYGKDSYDIGTGFDHFGIAVEDVHQTVELCKSKGVTVSHEPGPVKGGTSFITFVNDPDGYKFELLQRPPTPEPFAQVCLRVGDLERSMAFYETLFGLYLLSKTDVPEYKYSIAELGYGTVEQPQTVLELKYTYGVTKYTKGNGYIQIGVGTDDVYKTAEAVRAFGGQISVEPGPLPGVNTKTTVVHDPDGWKSVFFDNVDFANEL